MLARAARRLRAAASAGGASRGEMLPRELYRSRLACDLHERPPLDAAAIHRLLSRLSIYLLSPDVHVLL